MAFQFHKAFQTLMQHKADVLSGYGVVGGEPEVQAHIRVDYFFQLDLSQKLADSGSVIRPLSNQKQFNVVELEGRNRTLNDCRFRYHCARALLLENPGGKKSRRGKLGLTIVVVRRPVKLFQSRDYCFEKRSDWKYRVVPFKDLTVDIILLRELQKIEGGEAAVFLQLLEPDPKRRPKLWQKMLKSEQNPQQNLKSLMLELDEEAYMTVAEELLEEGRVEGREEGRVAYESLVGSLLLAGVDETVFIDAGGIDKRELDRIKKKLNK